MTLGQMQNQRYLRQNVGLGRGIQAVPALDVSVQAQILNLLQDLQTDLNLTYIFSARDLSVVEYIANRIVIRKRKKWTLKHSNVYPQQRSLS